MKITDYYAYSGMFPGYIHTESVLQTNSRLKKLRIYGFSEVC